MSVLIEAVGWGGASLILSAYIANSNGWLGRQDWRYQLLNLVGACSFVVYTAAHNTWATMTLNGIWACVAVVALVRMLRGERRKDSEE
jgi:hypothetical protein